MEHAGCGHGSDGLMSSTFEPLWRALMGCGMLNIRSVRPVGGCVRSRRVIKTDRLAKNVYFNAVYRLCRGELCTCVEIGSAQTVDWRSHMGMQSVNSLGDFTCLYMRAERIHVCSRERTFNSDGGVARDNNRTRARELISNTLLSKWRTGAGRYDVATDMHARMHASVRVSDAPTRCVAEDFA